MAILQYWANTNPVPLHFQPDVTNDNLKAHYSSLQKNADAHSFIGLLDEQLICRIDCYRLQTAALGQHMSFRSHDAGIHLFMAPQKDPIQGLSSALLQTFMLYYFKFPEAQCLYAEPDIYNHKACQLLRKCGFAFVQNIILSHHAASLYLMTKHQFHLLYQKG